MQETPGTGSASEGADAGTLVLAPERVEKLEPVKPASAGAVRGWCLLIFLLCGAMLGAGLWLKPAAAGVGTHRALGLQPCGMLTMTGIPCPTCGCTTAVSYAVRGQVVKSFITQPFGLVVALVGMVLGGLGLAGVVTGRWYGPSTFLMNWYWRSIFFGAVGILAVAWVYKIVAMRLGIVA